MGKKTHSYKCIRCEIHFKKVHKAWSTVYKVKDLISGAVFMLPEELSKGPKALPGKEHLFWVRDDHRSYDQLHDLTQEERERYMGLSQDLSKLAS